MSDFERWLEQGIQRIKDAGEWHPEDFECKCPLPSWLESWACEVCDYGFEQGTCECFVIMRAADNFRSEHPHA